MIDSTAVKCFFNMQQAWICDAYDMVKATYKHNLRGRPDRVCFGNPPARAMTYYMVTKQHEKGKQWEVGPKGEASCSKLKRGQLRPCSIAALLVSQPRQLPSHLVTLHYASHINLHLSAS